MNDGTFAMILQWTLLVCVWMGLFDRELERIGLTRTSGLVVLTGFLVCSFADWKLYFLPVNVNLSGGILPFFLAGWMWMKLPSRGREYIIAACALTACVLLFIRKLLFWDPILMIFDEKLLVPVSSLLLTCFITRRLEQQWFLLLVSVPLADLLYVLSNLSVISRYSADDVIGGAWAQDSFWMSVALWIGLVASWNLLKRMIRLAAKPFQEIIRSKSKTESNS